jgi:type II secretory pathway component PulK
MKTTVLSSVHPGRRRGSAVLVVLVLLALMMVFISANSFTLHSLKRDLHRLEQKQLRRYRAAPLSNTNLVSVPGPTPSAR